MVKAIRRIYFFVGSLFLIIGTVILIAIVRITKFLMREKVALAPEADIFLDSKKQPLSPNLKQTIKIHESKSSVSTTVLEDEGEEIIKQSSQQ